MENLTIQEVIDKLAEAAASSGWGESLPTNVVEIRKTAHCLDFDAGTVKELEELKEENDEMRDEIETLRNSVSDLESQCNLLEREKQILRERLDKYPKGR